MLELLKVIVQPVILERDEDGKVLGEKFAEPTALYDPEQIQAFVAELDKQIKAANKASQNSGLIVPNSGVIVP